MATVVTTQTTMLSTTLAQAALMIQVTRQCISYLIFAMILIVLGGISFSSIGSYVLGVNAYYSCFWIAAMMIISCSLGITTYNAGLYRRDTAPVHAAFVGISGLATIPGTVFLSINISTLARVIGSRHPAIISSMVVNCIVLLFYISYICVCIFQFVTYFRLSKLDANQVPMDIPMQQQAVMTSQQTGYSQQTYTQAQVQTGFSQPPSYSVYR